MQRDDQVLLVALSRRPLRLAAVELGRARGFKVLTTDRPDLAVATARSLRPAGLVVGMDLLADDQTSLLRALKTDPETRHVPTIAVHSARAADDILVGRHAGALRIVEEPVTTESLDVALEDLRAYLGRKTRSLLVVSGAGPDEPSAVVALFGAVPDVDLHVATTRVGGGGRAGRPRLRLRGRGAQAAGRHRASTCSSRCAPARHCAASRSW